MNYYTITSLYNISVSKYLCNIARVTTDIIKKKDGPIKNIISI